MCMDSHDVGLDKNNIKLATSKLFLLLPEVSQRLSSTLKVSTSKLAV